MQIVLQHIVQFNDILVALTLAQILDLIAGVILAATQYFHRMILARVAVAALFAHAKAALAQIRAEIDLVQLIKRRILEPRVYRAHIKANVHAIAI